PARPPPPGIDRTAKLFIDGKQVRPDSGYSLTTPLGEVGLGNRKDIRNAVEAARKAQAGWAKSTAHRKAQMLFYCAENLEARAEEFATRISAVTGGDGHAEVAAAVRRLFSYGAWADKWDGRVHHTPFRNVTMAMPEPIGVMGVVCDDAAPLLGFVSLVAPAIAMGNTVIVVPSEAHPLAAADFYQVIETSDVPAGVINIVTGHRTELTDVLAAHDDVDGMWYAGPRDGLTAVERLSAGNMKRTWAPHDVPDGEGEEYLREATQVKNIWIPYGE
ncbi:MAG: aldehyde dehydrogenase, partial [Gemmatimonadales bacterium]